MVRALPALGLAVGRDVRLEELLGEQRRYEGTQDGDGDEHGVLAAVDHAVGEAEEGCMAWYLSTGRGSNP